MNETAPGWLGSLGPHRGSPHDDEAPVGLHQVVYVERHQLFWAETHIFSVTYGALEDWNAELSKRGKGATMRKRLLENMRSAPGLRITRLSVPSTCRGSRFRVIRVAGWRQGSGK